MFKSNSKRNSVTMSLSLLTISMLPLESRQMLVS